MKFVKTTRQFRSGIMEIKDRATLNADGSYSPAISDKQFTNLAIAYEHGIELHISKWIRSTDNRGYSHWERTNTHIVLKKQYPTKEWHYDMVTTLPSTYVAKHINTPEEAYDFGKRLIEAVYKNNRLPYDVLIANYMAIARACERANVTYNCMNETVRMTVKAELEAAADIANLQDYSRSSDLELTDEAIGFYSRAFGIEVPAWFLKYSLVKTKHGWAQLPKLTAHAGYNTTGNGERPAYAGNLDESGATQGSAPYTLLRDAVPVQVQTAQRAQIVDTIAWYLNLAPEDQRTFLTDNFVIDEEGTISENDPEVKEKEELRIIEETMENIQNGTIDYNDYD